jgi:Ca2+-transporting ATPase
MTEQWHNIDPDDALRALNSKRSGLTEEQAKALLLEFGPNELKGKKRVSPFIVFLRQFLNPLVYILLVAVIISFVVGHLIDAVVILAVLVLNAVIGFTQEVRAEKAMEALIQMAAPKAEIRRNGRIKMVSARELVPGDILLLDTGDKVPADARLLDVSNLKVNEAALTGESMPVDKHTSTLSADKLLSDRKNMVYAGTIVTYGRSSSVIVETSMSTELGKIASAIQEVEPPETPVQRNLNRLSRYFIALFLGICGLLVIAGLLKGFGWLEVFLLAVAAAVSAIPEGLPAVVTVILAAGMRTMANRNAIIRKLVAVETLGSATIICTDKTGTLTLNEMTVRNIFVNGQHIEVSGEGYQPQGEFSNNGQTLNPATESELNLTLRIGSLCNDALVTKEEQDYNIYGDPTEGAILVAAAKAGLNIEKLQKAFPRLDEILFQSEKQYMATLHPIEGRKVAYIKGAPERILSMSKYVMKDNEVVPLSEEDAGAITQANADLAGEAMRVIATAYIDLPADLEDFDDEHIRSNLVFIGLLGMIDPPRDEAKDAVRLCRQAGIKVVMITGDNKLTAQSIAEELDLPQGRAVTGADLHGMSDEDLFQQVEDITVFARIEPLHKLRIVKAFKRHGHIVAMTGDGVNDAPALKSASIGISMGITGTDVAKEASNMVLADDNFASIVAAVDEGRAIFNRLRNAIFFLLSTNIGELLAMILAVWIIGKAPLLAVQIIWVNLVTDSTGAIPLGVEPKVGDELKQPPRHPRAGLIYPGLLIRVIYMAIFMGVGTFLVFNWAQATMTLEEARTIAFSTMVAFEWFKAFNARSDEHTVFKLGLFKNRWLTISIAVSILLQLAVVYLPFFQTAFSTVPLNITQWGIIILAGGSLFLIEELRKFFFPRLFNLGKWKPLKKES